jgi:ribose 5-phosphate isomerase B
MKLYIGSDHGGFEQKRILIERLLAAGHEVHDEGTHSEASTDYPQYALAVGKAVQADAESRGILLCRSGEGMEIAVNKLNGIRAALVWRPDLAVETRNDNNSNVLVLPSDFVSNYDVEAIVDAFLATPFSNAERHMRRLEMITEIEKGEK